MLQFEVSKGEEKSNKVKIIFLTQNLMPTDFGDKTVKIVTEFLLNCKKVPNINQAFMSSLKLIMAKTDPQVVCQIFKVKLLFIFCFEIL